MTLISLCVPVMNRLSDVQQTLPTWIAAAEASPPVELCVLDYNSSDGLQEYLQAIECVTYRRYTGRAYYHMAHARNLSVKMSEGEYALISCADIFLRLPFLEAVRGRIAEGCVWTYTSARFVCCVCVRRDEFETAGGFDERFEFYGKEDKDLLARLRRRGAKSGFVPDTGLSLIYTPWEKKLVNYRSKKGRRWMGKYAKAIYEENCAAGVMVANAGKEWGSWD